MFEISVNGKVFTNWITATVTRSMDDNTGKFSFTSSNVTPANYPVRDGDAVQILVDKTPILTGFCELSNSFEEEGEDKITIQGRDTTCDLIDSSMPDAVKSIFGPLSFLALCQQVIDALGASIPVSSTVSGIKEFSELDFFGADAAKKCMDYLTDFARKRQVYLISNGAGGMLIFRPPSTLLAGSLINRIQDSNNNVKSSSLKLDHSRRYGRYQSRSQDNFGADPDADYDAGVDRKGFAVDDQIRASRFLEIQAEESMDDTENKDRAVEELNIRRARATEYSATVVGVLRAPNLLWDIGQLTKVDDQKRDIKGIFVTRTVAMTVDKNSGTLTKLTLAPPEAYNVRVPTQGDRRRAVEGETYQVSDRSDAAVRRFNR